MSHSADDITDLKCRSMRDNLVFIGIDHTRFFYYRYASYLNPGQTKTDLFHFTRELIVTGIQN